MFVRLPNLSILAHIADSDTDMYVDPSGNQLYVSIPPDNVILMFIVEEDLNVLSAAEVNAILQRELLKGI
jgi:hypothetical protein